MYSKQKIILYNPKAVFFDMPLALLAIGSALDADQYEVIIVDGRIEDDPLKLIQQHADEAICFGVTVITGAPITDALFISERVKQLNPNLPVIWGGWHTSLFPTEPMQDHSFIDITVQGQGEVTFCELVEAFTQNTSIETVKGISYRKEDELVKNPPRPLTPMERFDRIDYSLIDVERYFKKKGKRQFDYISSVGCFYRCSFCADPFVYQNRFQAISAEKMVADLAYYQEQYQFTDLNFQDETFFTKPKRIKQFAEAILERGLKFSWAATMRADQGNRLSDEVWELCKKAGLRRLLIGVESGAQEMMDWMKKDIKITQVFYCADKCKELGIDVIFPFIVGFPGESDDSIRETVSVIKRLRKKSNGFETPIFYFKPYPGSEITQNVVKNGFELPKSTNEWGEFDYIGSSGPWVSKEKEEFFEAFKFYLKWGYNKHASPLLKPLKAISKWRCETEQFGFPFEKAIIERLKPAQQLS